MIRRDPGAAEKESYDLIVVGGGVYGTSIALESVSRGLRPLLLEKADFGGATSAGSLRILHGGLRYLQSLDLPRFRRSVEQRRWWLRHFPDLVHPFSCLMPLHGQGLKRPAVLRAALLLNDILSADRNREVRADRQIGSGRVISPEETLELFPGCEERGLLGGATWEDVWMASPHRLMIEMLRWTVAAGGEALNYVSARDLRIREGRVAGVVARDEISGQELEFDAATVINAAGPWSADIAAHFDEVRPELFEPSLAFNVLLRTLLPAATTVAVFPSEHRGSAFFLKPEAGGTLAGTRHLPWTGGSPDGATPSPDDIARFLQDLASAIPGFAPSLDDVVRVLAGLVPAAEARSAEVRKRPSVVDHRDEGGPEGLVSVSGVKFTTAPGVARDVLDQVSGPGDDDGWERIERVRPPVRAVLPPEILGVEDEAGREELQLTLRDLIASEAALSVEDLVQRRLDWNLVLRDPEELLDAVAAYVPELPRSVATAGG